MHVLPPGIPIPSRLAAEHHTLLRLEQGSFGFIDSAGARRDGDRRIVAEMTIRAGKVVWDLNGRAARDWRTFPYQKRAPRP